MRIVLLQAILAAFAFLSAVFVVRAVYPIPFLSDFMRSHDILLLAILAAISAALMFYAFSAGRSIVFPLGRLIVLARTMEERSGDRSSDSLKDFRASAYGELDELESSIHRMRRDLIVTTQSLRVQAEELAVLLSHVSDAVLAVGVDQKPLFFNARFAALFRIPTGAPHDRHLSEILRAPAILEAVETALEDAIPRNVEVVAISIHETNYYFSISVSPLRNADKKVYGALAIFHDVTGLKKSEQIRSEFVANVSHELRTPLTSIQGYLDTAIEDLRGGRLVEIDHLAVAQRNADRLMHLICDLLDISSLESGHDSIELSVLSTRGVTDQVLRQLEKKISDKQLVVDLNIGAETVQADPARLEQVMINLVDNASKFTPAGGRITVAWKQNANSVSLEVGDTGPGIPVEHQARLFERFYRVDKARSRELGGTGLGLAIVKHIMSRHGGEIAVSSVMGEGTRFTARFPISL